MIDDAGEILTELVRYIQIGAGYSYIEQQTADTGSYRCIEGPDGKVHCKRNTQS